MLQFAGCSTRHDTDEDRKAKQRQNGRGIRTDDQDEDVRSSRHKQTKCKMQITRTVMNIILKKKDTAYHTETRRIRPAAYLQKGSICREDEKGRRWGVRCRICGGAMIPSMRVLLTTRGRQVEGEQAAALSEGVRGTRRRCTSGLTGNGRSGTQRPSPSMPFPPRRGRR